MNRSTNSSLTLPTHVLSHCFFFLGSSGHYYFLASVCKDFKVAVEELYKGSRNTSAESIISSVSTYHHVVKIVDSSTICKKIVNEVFENDRVDIFTEFRFEMMKSVVMASYHGSTEIMRSIIADERVVYEMMNDPIHVFVPIACDKSMIQYLMEKGFEFNGMSVVHALRRKDLETFSYLLDFVVVANECVNVRAKIIDAVFDHAEKVEAIRLLKQKQCFVRQDGFDGDMCRIAATAAARDDISFDLIKFLLEDAQWLQHDVLSKSFLLTCIAMKRTDILSYIHNSIYEIDVNFCLQVAEGFSVTEVIEFLQQL